MDTLFLATVALGVGLILVIAGTAWALRPARPPRH